MAEEGRFGTRVRELMKRSNMTVRQLATSAGLTETHLYRLLKGTGGTKPKTVLRLATSLGLDPGGDDFRALFLSAGYRLEESPYGPSRLIAHGHSGQVYTFDSSSTSDRAAPVLPPRTANVTAEQHRELERDIEAHHARIILANADTGVPNPVVDPSLTADDVKGAEEDILELLRAGVSSEVIGKVIVERIWARRRFLHRALKEIAAARGIDLDSDEGRGE